MTRIEDEEEVSEQVVFSVFLSKILCLSMRFRLFVFSQKRPDRVHLFIYICIWLHDSSLIQ